MARPKKLLYIAAYLLGFVIITNVYPVQKKPRIIRAIVTTQIIDREPVDQVLYFANTSGEVYFFTELRHFDGQSITHQWIYNDKVVSSVNFDVKGPRWRVYSKLALSRGGLGRWTVLVLNQDKKPLKATVFHLVDDKNKQIIIPLK